MEDSPLKIFNIRMLENRINMGLTETFSLKESLKDCLGLVVG